MDVSSVSSSYSPAPSAKPQQTEAVRTEPQEKPRESASQESQEPKPVVNAQGQTTGRIVNTSA